METECKKGKSHKVEETDGRGFHDDNELDDIDTFIHKYSVYEECGQDNEF
jgi:hypothetical protein